jgi:hypothetical protein
MVETPDLTHFSLFTSIGGINLRFEGGHDPENPRTEIEVEEANA